MIVMCTDFFYFYFFALPLISERAEDEMSLLILHIFHKVFTVSNSSNMLCFQLIRCITVYKVQSFEMCTHWKRLTVGHDSCFHLLTVCLSRAHDLH